MRHRLFLYQLLFVASASAHELDVSKSEIAVDGTSVHVRVETNARQLDEITLAELTREQTVSLGGRACDPSATRTGRVERDGAFAQVDYACAQRGALAIDLAWLKRLSAGHRHVARLVIGEAALTAVLTAEHTTATLEDARARPPSPAWPAWPLYVVIALALLFVVRSKLR